MWRASVARLLPEYIMLDGWPEGPVRVLVFRHEVRCRSKSGGGDLGGGELVQGGGVASYIEAAEPTESEG